MNALDQNRIFILKAVDAFYGRALVTLAYLFEPSYPTLMSCAHFNELKLKS